MVLHVNWHMLSFESKLNVLHNAIEDRNIAAEQRIEDSVTWRAEMLRKLDIIEACLSRQTSWFNDMERYVWMLTQKINALKANLVRYYRMTPGFAVRGFETLREYQAHTHHHEMGMEMGSHVHE